MVTPGATSLRRDFINSSEFAPGSTSLRLGRQSNQWLVLSHANFNVSLLQVCNCSASAIREPVDRLDADPSKVVFVNSVLDRLYDEVRAPGKAVPRADGLSMA